MKTTLIERSEDAASEGKSFILGFLERLLKLFPAAVGQVASQRLQTQLHPVDLSRSRSSAATGSEQSEPETCLGDVSRSGEKKEKNSHNAI